MLCEDCKDQGFVIKSGVKEPCVCAKMRKLLAYAPRLVKSLASVDKKIRQESTEVFDESPSTFLRLRRGTNQNIVDMLMLFWLLKHGQPDFRDMNVYELIEIFLQHHPTFKSMYDLKFPALILLEGYDEFPNRRQSEAIMQVLEIMRTENSKVLFVSLKPATEQAILDYFKIHNWKTIDLTKGGKGSYERI